MRKFVGSIDTHNHRTGVGGGGRRSYSTEVCRHHHHYDFVAPITPSIAGFSDDSVSFDEDFAETKPDDDSPLSTFKRIRSSDASSYSSSGSSVTLHVPIALPSGGFPTDMNRTTTITRPRPRSSNLSPKGLHNDYSPTQCSSPLADNNTKNKHQPPSPIRVSSASSSSSSSYRDSMFPQERTRPSVRENISYDTSLPPSLNSFGVRTQQQQQQQPPPPPATTTSANKSNHTSPFGIGGNSMGIFMSCHGHRPEQHQHQQVNGDNKDNPTFNGIFRQSRFLPTAGSVFRPFGGGGGAQSSFFPKGTFFASGATNTLLIPPNCVPFRKTTDSEFESEAAQYEIDSDDDDDENGEDDDDTSSIKSRLSGQVKSLKALLRCPPGESLVRTVVVSSSSSSSSSDLLEDLDDDYLGEEERELEKARQALTKEISQIDFSLLKLLQAEENDDDGEDNNNVNGHTPDTTFHSMEDKPLVQTNDTSSRSSEIEEEEGNDDSVHEDERELKIETQEQAIELSHMDNNHSLLQPRDVEHNKNNSPDTIYADNDGAPLVETIIFSSSSSATDGDNDEEEETELQLVRHELARELSEGEYGHEEEVQLVRHELARELSEVEYDHEEELEVVRHELTKELSAIGYGRLLLQQQQQQQQASKKLQEIAYGRLLLQQNLDNKLTPPVAVDHSDDEANGGNSSLFKDDDDDDKKEEMKELEEVRLQLAMEFAVEVDESSIILLFPFENDAIDYSHSIDELEKTYDLHCYGEEDEEEERELEEVRQQFSREILQESYDDEEEERELEEARKQLSRELSRVDYGMFTHCYDDGDAKTFDVFDFPPTDYLEERELREIERARKELEKELSKLDDGLLHIMEDYADDENYYYSSPAASKNTNNHNTFRIKDYSSFLWQEIKDGSRSLVSWWSRASAWPQKT